MTEIVLVEGIRALTHRDVYDTLVSLDDAAFDNLQLVSCDISSSTGGSSMVIR